MAALPARTESPSVAAIYGWWAAQLEAPRAYLGGSKIGAECERAAWYSFRWATGGESFDGRMKRLFNRGHREEPLMLQELRGIGCEVYDLDPATGKQFRFTAVGGHFGGGLDGVARGVPEAPKAWHVLEFKTHNAKSFAALVKDGVEKAKPEHVAQMQVYMALADMPRALYLAVNKDTDELYSERIRADTTVQAALMAKAARIIYAPEPLPGISTDPAFYKCKFCPAAQVCHGLTLPAVNCRTCLHATPEPDGDGRWSCALAPAGEAIPAEFQARGCPSHLYIPAMLAKWGAVEDATESNGGGVLYRAADGFEFANAVASGPGKFTSRELKAATPAMLRDAQFQAVRNETGGTIVERDAA